MCETRFGITKTKYKTELTSFPDASISEGCNWKRTQSDSSKNEKNGKQNDDVLDGVRFLKASFRVKYVGFVSCAIYVQ